MCPYVEDAINQFGPDLIIVDQQTLGGMLAARRTGMRWVSSATTSAGVVNPFQDLPTIKAWFDQQMDALQTRFGLPAVVHPDRSPIGTLVFSSRSLVGQAADTLPSAQPYDPTAVKQLHSPGLNYGRAPKYLPHSAR